MNTVNDPKGEAGAKKAPMWLLPPVALEQTAWVHKLGNDKYGPFNWRKTGVCATTYVSAIMRHLNAWRDGEDLDPESGISHIAHIATSCNILLDAAACGTLQDDRNKRPTTPVVESEVDFLGRLTTTGLEDTTPGACPWIGLIDKTADLTGVVADPKKFIDLDGGLVELPPVPEGYDWWVYRGRGWQSDGPVMYGVLLSPTDSWSVVDEADETLGSSGCYYIEAIKNDDCQKTTVAPLPREALFGAIKPGDYVEGWLVHGQEFDGHATNIVDIRGTKVFHFSDRPSLTEDEIYSITRA